MKISKKSLKIQQTILDKKIQNVTNLRDLPRPRSGWLKAIRTALGISTRQMGERIGVTHQVVMRLERGETQGTITLESLHRLANAMDCSFVYAVVPARHESLDALLEEKANHLAKSIVTEVSHSMRMENQGVDKLSTDEQIRQLAKDLKESLDPRLWSPSK